MLIRWSPLNFLALFDLVWAAAAQVWHPVVSYGCMLVLKKKKKFMTDLQIEIEEEGAHYSSNSKFKGRFQHAQQNETVKKMYKRVTCGQTFSQVVSGLVTWKSWLKEVHVCLHNYSGYRFYVDVAVSFNYISKVSLTSVCGSVARACTCRDTFEHC